MKVEHRFQLSARCPVDDARDLYVVTIRTDRMIRVEDIVAAAEKLANEPMYQEHITHELACRFGVEVETVGTHMHGHVTTTCTEQPS